MLTQLATLKSRLGLDLFDTTDDVVITSILKHVSARFAAECNRIFDYGAGLTYEFRANQINIIVDHPPIELVSQFDLKTPRHKAGYCNPRLTICSARKNPSLN